MATFASLLIDRIKAPDVNGPVTRLILEVGNIHFVFYYSAAN